MVTRRRAWSQKRKRRGRRETISPAARRDTPFLCVVAMWAKSLFILSGLKILRCRGVDIVHHLHKLAVLDHLGEDIQTAQQLALEEHHGECGPVNMGLQSLADIIVFQNVKRIIGDSLIGQEGNQFPTGDGTWFRLVIRPSSTHVPLEAHTS